MLSHNLLCSAFLALLSGISAAPTSAPSPENGFEGLTAVEFKGNTIYINAALMTKEAPTSPVKRSNLLRRENLCGNSSINPAPSGPYSQVSDCWVVRDWANTNDAGFDITDVNNYAALVWFQSCVFKARPDIHQTNLRSRVGSGDISDLVRDSINKWQVNGEVGARGNMNCKDRVLVNWALVSV